MKKLVALSLLALSAAGPAAQAASYNVTTTFYEPDTQPNDTVFVGTFEYNQATRTIANLQGRLSESMTGGAIGYPNDTMTWLTLSHQLASWYDAALGGTFAATFRNSNTNTFTTLFGGDGWTPQAGIEAGAIYYGYPTPGNNPGNAYALIFVPDDPLAPLTPAQIDKLAYADCAPGGMMMAACMTGTSEAGYGMIGSMSGFPVSQTITAAIPEPHTYALMITGLGLLGLFAKRRASR